MTRRRAAMAFLAALAVLSLYLCYLLIAPFLKPIVFAVILAVVFYPVHTYLLRRIRNRNISAALSTLAVILLLALVSVFLGRAILSGLREVYQSLAANSGQGKPLDLVYLLDRATGLVSHYLPASTPDLRSAVLTQAERAVAGLLTAATGVLGSATSLVANAFLAFFVLFFILRDGRSMLRRAAVVLPLRAGQVSRLFRSIKETLNAIVYGTLVIAAIQGILAGIAFWFLGLSSAALWGVVTGLCALVPVIGTAFVVLPAMTVLILGGHWIRTLVLLLWALAVVHPVDNLLRPYLIGGRVKLSTLYVFFALLGGVRAFGALGVFVGPLVLAVTVALSRFLREEQRTGNWSFVENSKSPPQRRPIPIAYR